MEKKMDISVVIATYGRPSLLMKCVQALAQQTFPKDRFEVIIITDGPDSATFSQFLALTAPFFGKVALKSLSSKKGPAAARNAGWRMAQGELIAFTDDDCLPSENWLFDYWEEYARSAHKEVALTGRVEVPTSSPPTDYEKNVSQLETASFITANCACSKKALEIVGGLDEDFTMAWREDSALEFALRLHKIPIVALQGAKVVHPVREAPWGVSLKDQKKSMFNALLYKKYPQLVEQEIKCRPPWFYYAIVFCSLLGVSSLVLPGPTGWLSLAIAMGLVAWFAIKRLSTTSKSITHIAEMVVTSLFIPFLSVYWNLYGAVKYRTLFL